MQMLKSKCIEHHGDLGFQDAFLKNDVAIKSGLPGVHHSICFLGLLVEFKPLKTSNLYLI